MEKKMICLNCNKKGHLKKNCKFPINSYGIISYKIEFNEIKFLMIQRKFSYSLLSLLLGKYYDNGVINEYKLIEIIKKIPYTEKYYIQNYTFEYLWSKIWIWEFHQYKYLDLHNKYKIFVTKYAYLLNTIYPIFIEPEWEFPKGKRKFGESFVNCAIRECTEETNISPENIHVYDTLYKENFVGTNNVLYCNNYYISNYTINDSIYYNYHNKNQNNEIRKIGWFTIEQILKKINHQKHKIHLLISICNSISIIEKIDLSKELNILKFFI
jgi:8-oxo-dGTP pyrophosphatase MutT (NUDIX family)